MANHFLDKNSERVLPSHSDSKQLANEFNQFYVDKVQKIRNSISPVESDSEFYSRPFQGQWLTEFEPTNVEEVKELIKEFGVKTR